MLSLLATEISQQPLKTEVYRRFQSSIYENVQSYFLPEGILLLVILLLLLLEVGPAKFRKNNKSYHWLALSGLVAAFFLCLGQNWQGAAAIFLDWGWLHPWNTPSTEALGTDSASLSSIAGSMLAGDGLSHFFRLFLLLTGILSIWMSASAKEMKDRRLGEFYALMLGSLVGMMLLSASNHMLMTYLAIEMMSLPSYVLVAFRRKERRATEASLKYMLFGSVASGIMIYGISLLYGLLGGVSFTHISQTIGEVSNSDLPLLSFSILLFLVGLGYKMAIAPMHFWCPDAYEGAPTPVTAFLSVASKAAGFALALRFVYLLCAPTIEGQAPSFPWIEVLSVLSILTMTIGNFGAIRQNNIKRMLAYSSIAHAGYLLIGITAMATGRLTNNETLAEAGIIATLVYLLAYMITNYGAFGTVVAIENQDNDNETIEAFKGLAKRNLGLAIFAFVIFLSLLGVPPTLGFLGKVKLFFAGVDAAKANPVLIVVLIAAGINTAVSAYYYFKVVREMFLTKVERGEYRPFSLPGLSRSLIALTSILILVGFIFFQVIDSEIQNRIGYDKRKPERSPVIESVEEHHFLDHNQEELDKTQEASLNPEATNP